jgi:glutamyl-tRNA synthetase
VGGDEVDPDTRARVVKAVALSQDRMRPLGEAPELLEFFFREPDPDVALLLERGPGAAEAAELLRAAAAALEGTGFTEAELESAPRGLAGALGCGTGRLFWLVRVAATGRRAAPPLFGVLSALGRSVVLSRSGLAARALETEAWVRARDGAEATRWPARTWRAGQRARGPRPVGPRRRVRCSR